MQSKMTFDTAVEHALGQAMSEDSRFSFAGQFDSRLMVQPEDLDDAYRFVVASRFNDRAVLYRLNCGFREVDTPMAVLFMPMIDPVAAGVIYTTDPYSSFWRRLGVSLLGLLPIESQL